MELHAFKSVHSYYTDMTGIKVEENKLRDKLTIIVDAVGIDSKMLKGGPEIKDFEGKTIKGSAYAIPSESIDFLANIINLFTTDDFQKIRCAEFREASIEDLQYLYDGFTKYLEGRGYDRETICYQQQLMDRRLHYKIRVVEERLKKELKEIYALAEEYEDSLINFNYDDKVYFINFMASKIKEANKIISRTYMDYTDIRGEELSDLALLDCDKETPYESNVRITKDLMLAETLENDSEYQELKTRLEEVIVSPDFVNRKKGIFNKIRGEMLSIEEKHQKRLFGELLLEEENDPITVRHPLDVLAEAVEYAEEYLSSITRDADKRALRTPEEIEKEKQDYEAIRKFLEEKGHRVDLPDIEKEEEAIFVNSSVAHSIKGMISFPCCEKEKIIVYEGTSGLSSNKCPRCGKYALFIYDDLTSKTVDAARGVSHRFGRK